MYYTTPTLAATANAMPDLEPVIIEPTRDVRASVIWMHGLGADAHDFEPIVPELQLDRALGVRFVFPNAPVRAVTINNGMRMRAWYDVLDLDIPRREDEIGVRDSAAAISALVDAERAQGIPAERIVLAGFSQGAAMALFAGLRYPQPLGGILALSGYLPLFATLSSEAAVANRDTPVLFCHGEQDPVIPARYGRMSAEHLQRLGYRSEFRSYPMGHQVCLEEIRDIGGWLAARFKPRATPP